MTFGKRLKEMRTRCNLKQIDIATACGVSRPAVAAWELDRNEPSLAAIREICLQFKIRPSFLLGIDDIMDPLPGEFGKPVEDISLIQTCKIPRNIFDNLSDDEVVFLSSVLSTLRANTEKKKSQTAGA